MAGGGAGQSTESQGRLPPHRPCDSGALHHGHQVGRARERKDQRPLSRLVGVYFLLWVDRRASCLARICAVSGFGWTEDPIPQRRDTATVRTLMSLTNFLQVKS